MKRIVTLILALVLVLSLAACGEQKAEITTEAATEATTEAPKAVDLTAGEVLEALKAELGESYGCSVAEEEERAAGYFGLDMTRVESLASEVHAVSSVNMDQAIVVKVKDGYAQEAAACLQEGFNQKAGYAQMYNMDLYRIAETRIFVQDNYVAMLLLGQRGDEEADEETQASFADAEAQKVDAAWEKIFGQVPENLMVMPEPQQQGGGMRPRQ